MEIKYSGISDNYAIKYAISKDQYLVYDVSC